MRHAVLLAALALAACSCGKPAPRVTNAETQEKTQVGPTKPGEAPAGEKKVYTRDEFRREFMGAKLDEVRAKLGAPDDVNNGNSDSWPYKKRTKSNRTGAVDREVVVQHKDDRVYSISPGPD